MRLFIGKLLPFIIFRLHEKRLISMTLNPESLSKAFAAYTPARTKHINVRACAGVLEKNKEKQSAHKCLILIYI